MNVEPAAIFAKLELDANPSKRSTTNLESIAKDLIKNYKDWQQGLSFAATTNVVESRKLASNNDQDDATNTTSHNERIGKCWKRKTNRWQRDLANKMQQMQGALLHDISSIEAVLELQRRNADTLLEKIEASMAETAQQSDFRPTKKELKRHATTGSKSKLRTTLTSRERVAELL